MKIAKVDLAPGAMEIRAVIMDRTSRGLKTSDFDIVRETKYKSATVSEYRRKLCRAGLIKRGPSVMVRGKTEKTWVEPIMAPVLVKFARSMKEFPPRQGGTGIGASALSGVINLNTKQ